MKKLLQGKGVSAGTASGKVRLVKNASDCANFKEGEVLVTRMTDPTCTIAMAKASAIVCDIGGMTSHASVIARELGVPCVVATGNATSVLKNGEVVSVNGERGEVRCIVEVSGWLDDFIESCEQSLGKMDFATLQPFSPWAIHSLYSKEWCNYFFEIINSSARLNAREIALRMPSLGEAKWQFYYALLDAKLARLPREERMKIADFFKQFLGVKQPHDPFVLSGKNLVHSQHEVEQICLKQFHKGSPKIARLLGRIYSAGYQYAAGLYSDPYVDFCLENFGDYDASKKFGEGAILVVKSLQNLRPLDLWPQTSSLNHDSLLLYCVYDKSVRFKTDMISCHSVFVGDVLNGLAYWRVEADGKQVSENQLTAIANELEAIAGPQWIRLTKQPFEELKKTGVAQRCFFFKKLRERLGLPWRPTQKMLDAVKGKRFEPKKYFKAPKDEAKAREYWRKVLDPRVEFYPA